MSNNDDKDKPEVIECVKFLEALPPITHLKEKEKLCMTKEAVKEEPPKLELKPLPSTLKYAFLGGNNSYPVIIGGISQICPQDCYWLDY